MKRNDFKKILKTLGYSLDSIKSISIGRMKPTADKMFKLEDEFGIPLNAWRDIKSYLQDNDTKHQDEKAMRKGA